MAKGAPALTGYRRQKPTEKTPRPKSEIAAIRKVAGGKVDCGEKNPNSARKGH